MVGFHRRKMQPFTKIWCAFPFTRWWVLWRNLNRLAVSLNHWTHTTWNFLLKTYVINFCQWIFHECFFFLFVGQFHALIMMNREMTPLTGNEDLFSMYEFIKIHGILKNRALMAKKLLSQSFPLTCSWWWSIRNKCSDEIVNYMGLLINVCQKVHFLINNFVD